MPRIALTAFDKDFRRLGPIGGLIEPKVTLVHNGVGAATFQVRRDNPRWGDLQQPGARILCRVDGQPIMSGRVSKRDGDDGEDMSWTFAVMDDFAEVEGLLCRPDPANLWTAQTKDYDRRSGPAETVVKGVIAANAPGRFAIAPSLGRGANVSASWRFHPLLDRLDLTATGLGLKVLQDDESLTLDAYAPRVIPQVLQYPMVSDWSGSWTEPTVTRVIAASQGQGTQRKMRVLAAPAREAFWGSPDHPFVRETFMDARDLDTVDAEQSADLDRRMAEALAKGEATAGAKITLADTEAFSWRSGYDLGDVVRIRLDPGLPIVQDRIRSIILEETRASGFSVKPVVGDITLNPAVIPILMAKSLDRRVGALERI